MVEPLWWYQQGQDLLVVPGMGWSAEHYRRDQTESEELAQVDGWQRVRLHLKVCLSQVS